MSKPLFVHVPNNVVRDGNLSSIDFCVFMRLLFLLFITNSKDTIEVDIAKFKRVLNINDNRTLKSSIERLRKLGYICNNVKFNRRSTSSVVINMNKIDLKNNFTRLPTSIFKYIADIGHPGVRLLFYYESYINRKDSLRLYCYPSNETIKAETKLSNRSIIEYNKRLVKSKLLKMTQHDPEPEYDDIGELSWNRWNNHYDVRLENLL
ncbi:hypothetical protein [Paenibacillus sp. ISL-20]|uniref:hypothetical protein n=1 Tax=Paenibacillus sp. ISL-20 TaxID=2819163 RepID=UPI001BE79D02|nr:hypothetical protein [Paenibacillus sp. ISL-20]MBT2759871.1 hypothetical protein [Paenibacillus sp. ISL-20]